MLVLILLLVVGAILVYLSQYNFMPVSVNLGFYLFNDVPLFYVIIASVVTGLLLSYLVYLIHVITTSLTLRSKENEIKKNKDQVLELTKRVHQLELENAKLKPIEKVEPEDPKSL